MSRLDDLLERADARALVVIARSARDPYLAPFTGPVKLGPSFVLAPRGASLRLGYLSPMERDEARRTGLDLLTPDAIDVPRFARDGADPGALWANVLGRAFQLAGVPPGRIALTGLAEAGRVLEIGRLLAGDGFDVVPGESAVELVRKTKIPVALAEIRRVSEVTGSAFRRVAELLAATESRDGELWLSGERLRVARLTAEVARLFAEHGLEQPEDGVCAPAEEGAVPHNPGTPERVLRPAESLVVDLYPRGGLYSDCTRTFCVGKPPEALCAAHGAVLAALERSHAEARPGRRAWELQELACADLETAGYPTPISAPGTLRGYVHGLGHGVGYEVHELPSFRKEAGPEEGRLEEGDVFTLEPGLYDPEAGWAVRLEDLVHLGPGGLENLTPLPYDLDPRIWSANT